MESAHHDEGMVVFDREEPEEEKPFVTVLHEENADPFSKKEALNTYLSWFQERLPTESISSNNWDEYAEFMELGKTELEKLRRSLERSGLLFPTLEPGAKPGGPLKKTYTREQMMALASFRWLVEDVEEKASDPLAYDPHIIYTRAMDMIADEAIKAVITKPQDPEKSLE